METQTPQLPEILANEVGRTLEEWHVGGGTRRLWAGDASLWTGRDEAGRLGWLSVARQQAAHPHHLRRTAREAADSGWTHALLLGMGGSSLCPEVLRRTFGTVTGFPALHVLDSTDPAQIRACRAAIDIERTLFIVSSKSGSTTEPNIFKQYFFDEARRAVGAAEAGRRFIAVTDPGSPLEQDAAREGFRRVFHGVPEIGGRYSALSNFGMVPAAIMGLDVERLLAGALRMADSCAAAVPPAENPGVALGVLLGVLARRGRDKVTLVISPGIAGLGAWLEQLLAESTGKQGKGIVPVDSERPGDPALYGEDRLFVYARLATAPDSGQDAAMDALQDAGHPIVRIAVPEPYALGAEFFRWEAATAVAGAVLGINPFDQPDVEASKIATRALTAAYEKTGGLPPETPLLEEQGVRLYTDQNNARVLAQHAGSDRTLAGLLRAHLGRLTAGDYFALLAYIEMSAAFEEILQDIRLAVRGAKRVATCLGFGPRFLHSTGQAYKGGPNSGVFLQVTCEDAADLPVPGRPYSFGIVKAAQALGDFQVLAQRQRRVLRVHLGCDVASGLDLLRRAVRRAVA